MSSLTRKGVRSGPLPLVMMTKMFPCKKLRRSHRLQCKEKLMHFSRVVSDAALGYFEILPLELKFLVFKYLQVEELSILTISSKAMRNVVELYRGSSVGENRLISSLLTHGPVCLTEQAEKMKQFDSIGLLLKRSTCLYSTKDRLKLIHHFLDKFVCNVARKCAQPMKCVTLTCCGQFVNTVISGWDDKECVKAFNTISHETGMLGQLDCVIHKQPGKLPDVELNCRLFFRRLFVNHCHTLPEMSFWLGVILQRYLVCDQAKVLFLLFGATKSDAIQWYEMCESVPSSTDMAVLCFGDLANALRALHQHSNKRIQVHSITVLQDLISNCPGDWLHENVAHLLYLCGHRITVQVLSGKAIANKTRELACIITSLSMVCHRHQKQVSWVWQVITEVCEVIPQPADRLNLFYAIVDMFKEIIVDLYQFGGSGGEDNLDELETMLDAQSAFIRDLIHRSLATMVPQLYHSPQMSLPFHTA